MNIFISFLYVGRLSKAEAIRNNKLNILLPDTYCLLVDSEELEETLESDCKIFGAKISINKDYKSLKPIKNLGFHMPGEVYISNIQGYQNLYYIAEGDYETVIFINIFLSILALLILNKKFKLR
ncbi:hypothetical protein EHQ58_00960 [Leptospira ognonensis]|uniref:Uncharacterized protein n=2 Tax=Leptospira ognonensis TaxID=2484945 RepID=A0A4V3JSG5_9LEPT|nr:hypothetical protein EHQ58_00960 [Leptospira ognonensis]